MATTEAEPFQKPHSVSLMDLISMSDADFRPRKTVVFGTHGCGKTVYACHAESCVLLPLEDGYKDIHRWVPKKVPVLTFMDESGKKKKRTLDSYTETMKMVSNLCTMDHEFKNVVVDSAEAYESFCEAQTAKNAGKDFADIGFGKGREKASKYFADLLKGLDYLVDVKNMGVIVIAHEEVVPVQNLEGENYGKHTVRLDKSNRPLLLEWADDVLFIHNKVLVRTTESDFNKTESKALGQQEPLVYTTSAPNRDAKNRLGLPETIKRDWSLYEAAIKESGNYFLGERITKATGA